jgi:hypothetical protein
VSLNRSKRVPDTVDTVYSTVKIEIMAREFLEIQRIHNLLSRAKIHGIGLFTTVVILLPATREWTGFSERELEDSGHDGRKEAQERATSYGKSVLLCQRKLTVRGIIVTGHIIRSRRAVKKPKTY